MKNITSWFATNIDVAIVGNVLGTASLGLYNRAQTIAGYPRTFVTGVIDNVAFPLYAQITDDKSRVDHVLSQIQNIVMYLLSMMCIVVVLYAKPIVLLVLGSTWVEMVEPFKIIFVSYVFQTLLFSFNPLLRALWLYKTGIQILYNQNVSDDRASLSSHLLVWSYWCWHFYSSCCDMCISLFVLHY